MSLLLSISSFSSKVVREAEGSVSLGGTKNEHQFHPLQGESTAEHILPTGNRFPKPRAEILRNMLGVALQLLIGSGALSGAAEALLRHCVALIGLSLHKTLLQASSPAEPKVHGPASAIAESFRQTKQN